MTTTPNTAALDARGLEGLRVLVADDDETMRHLIRVSLKQIGIREVVVAPDGGQAFALFTAAPDRIDLIICDWLMPGLSGLDLLKEVRALKPLLPVLMLTGKADLRSVRDAVAAGVSAYIVKPFTPNQLQDKLRAVVQGAGLRPAAKDTPPALAANGAANVPEMGATRS